MKRGFVIACLISLATAVGAFAQGGSTNAPPPNHRPPRPMMDSLLGPRMLKELALTGEQSAKYSVLDADYKADVAKWRANNSMTSSVSTNAPSGGGHAQLRELRHSYIEKLRGILTPDQNTKLTELIENGPGRGRRGGGTVGGGTGSPAPAAGSN
ncbi:MAG TPA: hypothetical protein VMV72_14035 [Verrucomicrobiae bacterium]|nr:hypothetical protein [Verrucomicrobiae bacterium]